MSTLQDLTDEQLQTSFRVTRNTILAHNDTLEHLQGERTVIGVKLNNLRETLPEDDPQIKELLHESSRNYHEMGNKESVRSSGSWRLSRIMAELVSRGLKPGESSGE